MKRKLRTLVCALSATLLGVLAITTNSLVAGATANDASATKLLANALSAARKESGCTYTTTFSLAGHAYVLAARAGSSAGEQVISYDGAQIDLRLVGDSIYIYANAAGVKLQFGEADPTWAHRWIVLTSSDAKFKEFAAGVLLGSTVSELAPAELSTKVAQKTIDGASVVALSGKPNATIGLSAGKETLYLSSASRHLPVKLVVIDKPPSEVSKLTITFSHWGKAAVVATPSGATPLGKTTLPD
ncbi:MAG: hypothetical protein JWM55_1120 [Acidimicrobiaceae bacterium]|nr:hypothetical protein [Acidimicrobiaceae bacterium]